MARAFVFLTGIIPRGKGKAPDVTQPRAGVTREQLSESLDEAHRMVKDAANLSADKWLRHQVFGVLRRDKAIEFIKIHNNHHLRIIKDILAASQNASSDAKERRKTVDNEK